ncbi:Alpha-L-fucosidase [Anaerohalosphaera lusitana]|uniref:alpha-L-fucosidase n=1 Tax=Anaerohalosphaera lusitana TaxID=1936003 RepID=A0A1U9NQM0_9BACT|nr:alpha-L-fucosidase [Anaerohalosphaera lusitana]AQT70034.1 Alpha-L-fucosidase [Anaerohalosphaera lusitana]
MGDNLKKYERSITVKADRHKMYRNLLVIFISCVITAVPVFASFDPDSITGLQFWLDGNDLDGDGVAEGSGEAGISDGYAESWTDKSASGADVSASGTARPAIGSWPVNGKQAVRFVGNDDLMTGSNCPSGSSMTIFAAVYAEGVHDIASNILLISGSGAWALQMDSDQTIHGRVWYNNINYGKAVTNALTYQTPYCISYVYDEDTVRSDIYLNSQLQGTASTVAIPSATGDVFIGNHSAAVRPWKGLIGEVLIYSGALSSADCQQIETYLRDKWVDSHSVGQVFPPSITVYEEGETSDSFTLALKGDTPPVGDVTVTVDPAYITGTKDDIKLSSGTVAGNWGEAISLTFTPSNYTTAQTITVTPKDDTLTEDRQEQAKIGFIVTGGGSEFEGGNIPEVNATIYDNEGLPTPRPAQLAWQNAEFGLVYHYDLHVFDGQDYVQSENRVTKIPMEDIDMFNPVEYDMDQWIQTAVKAGARFAILTASHETGFRLWQSDVNPYSMKALQWQNGQGDIVRDFVDTCRKYSIEPGIYMGTRWNSYLGVYDFRVTDRSPVTQEEYNALIEAEVEEICTRYGDLFELWFDGGAFGVEQGGPDVLSVFEAHQDNCLFYHSLDRADARWGGNEDGTVAYPHWATMPCGPGTCGDYRTLKPTGDPDGQWWCPAMADAPLRDHEWFWEPNDENKIESLDDLMDMYYKSVGRNSTLILGVTPDDRGLIPEADVQRLTEFGEEIRKRVGWPVAETESTVEGDTVELVLPEPAQIDHVVIMEDIEFGERVREYVVEMSNDDGATWQQIASGISVGHKRIQRITPVTAERIRLRILQYVAPPKIKKLAVYGPDMHCGAQGYLDADVNRDCLVDLEDFSIVAADWLASAQ